MKHEKAAVVPMKANAFIAGSQANSQLMPLFPYLHPGALVPCVTALESDGQGKGIGYFVHYNTVDEVIVGIGGDGVMRTGEVYVGPKEHGVGRSPPHAFFSLAVITQRQLEEGEQPERVTFQCESCGKELFRHTFSGAAAGGVPALPTLVESREAALRFNSDEKLRTCAACGHVSAQFPLPIWGWDRYARNVRIAARAAEALQKVAP